MDIPFKQVDVFTRVRFKGNPVAVVLRADGLTIEQMQQIANWTNLSETTFVIPAVNPDADYGVRIFTPVGELPFAGHPTIGTAHALLEAGLVHVKNGALIQECAAGPVNLTVKQEADGTRWISFELPQPAVTPLGSTEVAELEAILGVEVLRRFTPCMVDVGARWIVAQLPDAEAVLANRPDLQRMTLQNVEDGGTGVAIFGEYPAGAPARIEVRAFAPAHGISEDPVCGSGNGAVGAFIRHTGQTAHFGGEFLSSEGAILGRAGLLRLSVSEQGIHVGGAAVTCIDG
ncbi:MAG: PhzF family phenazine biosynthesis protein, partial [Dehalococcoidia bacterium]|nr:PhzF family phenazine biosynthesis protein [Dehalococcoidia bacterium]